MASHLVVLRDDISHCIVAAPPPRPRLAANAGNKNPKDMVGSMDGLQRGGRRLGPDAPAEKCMHSIFLKFLRASTSQKQTKKKGRLVMAGGMYSALMVMIHTNQQQQRRRRKSYSDATKACCVIPGNSNTAHFLSIETCSREINKRQTPTSPKCQTETSTPPPPPTTPPLRPRRQRRHPVSSPPRRPPGTDWSGPCSRHRRH